MYYILRELQNNKNISSSFKNLNVTQISGNTVEATNITSLLLRTALVPVNNATVISKNGNVTVDNISDNNLTAINCNDNARGGIIYNFLHSNVNITQVLDYSKSVIKGRCKFYKKTPTMLWF